VITIGLLGGVASGKSLVAKEFEQLGAGRLDCDQVAHQVLQLPEVVRAIRQRWGDRVLDPSGQVDRQQVAKIVFAPTSEGRKERKFLEQLTHPLIADRITQQRDQLAGEGFRIVVLDAPLLLEAGWDKLCSVLVFVFAPRDVRLARAAGRGWTEAEFSAREQAQIPIELKRQRAHFEVDNSGPLEHTREQLLRIWGILSAEG